MLIAIVVVVVVDVLFNLFYISTKDPKS